MNERRRPTGRGRGRPRTRQAEGDDNPYRDEAPAPEASAPPEPPASGDASSDASDGERQPRRRGRPRRTRTENAEASGETTDRPTESRAEHVATDSASASAPPPAPPLGESRSESFDSVGGNAAPGAPPSDGGGTYTNGSQPHQRHQGRHQRDRGRHRHGNRDFNNRGDYNNRGGDFNNNRGDFSNRGGDFNNRGGDFNNRDGNRDFRGGRRNRRNRGRQNRDQGHNQNQQQFFQPGTPITPEGELSGWFDSAPRDQGGFIRRAESSYLPQQGDPFVPIAIVRQYSLRRGDAIRATYGRDNRGRSVVAEIQAINDQDPQEAMRRADFGALTATYPDRKLTLETGRPAKGGPELTRRAIDLIAPIGYGQRALIVAPARAGKTMLLHAITEGIAVNHPDAVLLILLVDERPEEVSEAISWGVGEVIASSFDMPAQRHTEVAEMVLERARRLVELGRDVVIVLDSITRMGRAYNTVERGTGRTLSGGLDATAMAKPKAFFGSARAVAPQAGGGSLTIIATALVETGSRMDDVIFEEFKGTGNCEIKLDRSLAEKRIFPAIDVATSGTRREDKLFRQEQLDQVYLLRRGLHQMPPQAAMEWLIKRIAATQNNDTLLAGL